MAKPTSETVIGLRRGPGGWSVVTYKVQDGKIVRTAVSEPNFRSLAIEQFRLAAARIEEEEQ